MPCRAFYDLTGPDAADVAKLMGVHGESPVGGALIEFRIDAGLLEVTAHARESFATLAMQINPKSDTDKISLAVTDRETGLRVVTERTQQGAVTTYQLDIAGDKMRQLQTPNPHARSAQLKEMSQAVLMRLLKTDSASFS